jgi:hypothetical protein
VELRAFGCFVLAYISVYALYWLFDHRDALVTSRAPGSCRTYFCQVGAGAVSYFAGLLAYCARSLNLKSKDAESLPPTLQIWIATGALTITGFFFSKVQCEEAFHLLFWEHVGLMGLVFIFPLVHLARSRFARSRD